ncbi:haloacid dehalogenase [Clostridium botulinum]|nr:haloacid dehalogenase [Clostridium botulinum]MCD3234120.1 HAD-IB family hydrolase [Clostridium botulinum D/C]KOC53380.1 haloacid dehalogenase [Clostridium botulinum]KOC57162.1 haloacid dehalogenase [Clostridium botulinum]MCD3239957.1 HAD-IB family hydrolase [Clostridium botulinum D/C]
MGHNNIKYNLKGDIIMTKTIAAFFDIDGTLYREGLITEIFKKFITSEFIEPERWYNEVRHYYIKWDKRLGNYDDYLLKMADIYIEAIKGLHKTQVEFIAKRVIESKGDRVYTYTRDMIAWHKKQGHKLITISGSPVELVREMALKHGFDDYIGTDYLIDGTQKYTGEIVPMWDRVNKQKAINNFVEKYNIDLNKSYAYGDTLGDFSMFKSVGNPRAINPTRELINAVTKDPIIKEKVKIIVERKDVVYKLNPDELDIF